MTIREDSGTHATLAGPEDTSEFQALLRESYLGRYVIIEPIGSGGMGTVYRAYDPQLNRGIALKLLSVKHADFHEAERAKARLIREAQALAQLSHPNVVAVHDVGTFEDDVFIAMELVEGKTLDDWMKEKKRAVKEILEVMIAAGQGLSAAHRAGLVHRDFKPVNVIVGDDSRVRVLDFGLARVAEQQELKEENPTMPETEPETTHERLQESKDSFDWKEISSDSSPNLLQSPLTHAGGVLGTPLYMAPEQHLGLRTDERTDQFGFCVVLYEALYRKRPFAGRSIEELKRDVIRQQVRIPKADSAVPAWLWRIIRKGLNAKPEDRYPNIDSLLEELGRDPEELRQQKRLVLTRRLIVISLILLTIALPLSVWYGLRYRTVQLCKQAENEFVGVWDQTTKTSVRISFLNTEKPFAQGTWERVEETVDLYISQWNQMRSDICEAKLLRGTLSEQLFDLRMSCLWKRVVELGALVKVFAKADAMVVRKAVNAISSLVGIAICADEKALRAPSLPPKSAEAKREVAAIRKGLADVAALEKTGKYKKGLKLAQKLEEQAKAVAYGPVQAEVLYQLGDLLDRTGEFKEAETSLNDAAQAAGESRDTLLVAKAMAQLALVVGSHQGRYEEGLRLGQSAKAVLRLAGGDDRTQTQLLIILGIILHSKGDYDGALSCYRNALEIQERTLGLEHPYVAHSLNNMGLVFEKQEDYNRALESYQRALKIYQKSLGLKHPYVASSLNNTGLVFLRQGEYDKSLEYQSKALEILQTALGYEHPRVVWPLSGLGTVFLEQGRPKQAIESLERAVDLCDKKTCEPDPHGRALFGLARAILATGEDKQQATKLAKQAWEIFGKTPEAFKKEFEEVNTWLQKHGEAKPAKKAD